MQSIPDRRMKLNCTFQTYTLHFKCTCYIHALCHTEEVCPGKQKSSFSYSFTIMHEGKIIQFRPLYNQYSYKTAFSKMKSSSDCSELVRIGNSHMSSFHHTVLPFIVKTIIMFYRLWWPECPIFVTLRPGTSGFPTAWQVYIWRYVAAAPMPSLLPDDVFH